MTSKSQRQKTGLDCKGTEALGGVPGNSGTPLWCVGEWEWRQGHGGWHHVPVLEHVQCSPPSPHSCLCWGTASLHTLLACRDGRAGHGSKCAVAYKARAAGALFYRRHSPTPFLFRFKGCGSSQVSAWLRITTSDRVQRAVQLPTGLSVQYDFRQGRVCSTTSDRVERAVRLPTRLCIKKLRV